MTITIASARPLIFPARTETRTPRGTMSSSFSTLQQPGGVVESHYSERGPVLLLIVVQVIAVEMLADQNASWRLICGAQDVHLGWLSAGESRMIRPKCRTYNSALVSHVSPGADR